MITFLSVLTPVLVGILLCSFAFRKRPLSLALLISIGAPIGLGISSSLWFVLNQLHLNAWIGFLIEITTLTILLFLQLNLIKSSLSSISLDFSKLSKQPILAIAAVLFFYSLLMDIGIFIFQTIQNPHGLWDAWADWNLGARFIFRSPYKWPALFNDIVWYFHTNYPLLQKGFIARCWLLIGNENLFIPAAFSFIIGFCTIGLLAASVSKSSNSLNGLLAGLVLLCTPFYMLMSSSQYADNTVGYFYLATIVMMTFARQFAEIEKPAFILAGVASGLAAWSKNEGLFFSVGLLLSQLVLLLFGKNWRELAKETKWIFAGLLPILAIVLYFKYAIAPTNEIVSAQGSNTISKLSNLSRYEYAFSWYKNRFSNFGEWVVNPWWLLLIGAILNWRNIKVNWKAVIPYLLLIGFVLAGGFFVFIIAELDMTSYLSTTVHRLYFQLFPSFIFLYFVAISPQKSKQ